MRCVGMRFEGDVVVAVRSESLRPPAGATASWANRRGFVSDEFVASRSVGSVCSRIVAASASSSATATATEAAVAGVPAGR